MASRSIGKNMAARRRAPKFSLDMPMAGLAAMSVAFVVWAMPDAFFAGAVSLTGLPALVPAAAPPLGDTARIGVALVAALATFAAVWLVLRALGDPGRIRRVARPHPEMAGAPKLRRADVHPDAPPRRPLFARHELGTPLDERVFEAAPAHAGDAPEESVLELDELARFTPAASVPEPEAPTLSHLMQRLELGLVRRQGSEPPSASADPVDGRLENALADLRRMAARSGE